MKTEIYYFSGTGNSMYAAKQLQKRIPGSILKPIVKSLKNNIILTEAEVVGFVFPNFCLTIPIPLNIFLNKADLTGASYIFAVCTRGGSPSDAFDFMNMIIKKQNKKINAQININLPWNTPVGKDIHSGIITDEKKNHMELELQKKLDVISGHIIDKKEYIKKDDDITCKLPWFVKVINFLLSRKINYNLHDYMYQKIMEFYADDKCSGCGICEKVCLNKKIVIKNGRPLWDKGIKCFACFACINFCPVNSIQIKSNFLVKSYTEINPRYHHKSVTYKDIADQR
ncbi:MAG: EFR1 family ferrodoxin [Spirochaetes bacterium]|nr:EFR1 family ferrodoxin [Spirochaetota bacterium]